MSVNESTRRYQHSDIGKAKTKEYQLGDVYKKYLAIYQKSDRFKELKRKYMYKRLYGVTIAQYEEMYTKQNGLCAICGNSETMKFKSKLKKLCVDHNHTTGKIRALLCDSCNKCVGLSKENIFTLSNMIDYLRKHQ